MTIELDNADFWDGEAYRRIAQDFTARYAERAWTLAEVPAGATVLDIAAGTGALAAVAARAGARVLATDFSPAMIGAIEERRLAGVEARVMDGQALDLPDACEDAAFSMFGIMLFPDWRAGLAEMARVLRPGGIACVGTWKEKAGAASNLLLDRLCRALLPEIDVPTPVDGMEAWRTPERFAAALEAAGLCDTVVTEVETDFNVDATMLVEPDRLFQFSHVWPVLRLDQRDFLVGVIRSALAVRGGVLPVPSPALIAVARRG